MELSDKGQSAVNGRGQGAPNQGALQTTGSAAGAITPPSPFGGNSAYGNSLLNREKK